MNTTLTDCYSSRLRAAMEANDCSPRELAAACDCSEERILGACKEGNDTPLGTKLHARAAFYLRQDSDRLYLGDSLPVRPDLEGPVQSASREWYELSSAQAKDAYHALLKQAVNNLLNTPRKRR